MLYVIKTKIELGLREIDTISINLIFSLTKWNFFDII